MAFAATAKMKARQPRSLKAPLVPHITKPKQGMAIDCSIKPDPVLTIFSFVNELQQKVNQRNGDKLSSSSNQRRKCIESKSKSSSSNSNQPLLTPHERQKRRCQYSPKKTKRSVSSASSMKHNTSASTSTSKITPNNMKKGVNNDMKKNINIQNMMIRKENENKCVVQQRSKSTGAKYNTIEQSKQSKSTTTEPRRHWKSPTLVTTHRRVVSTPKRIGKNDSSSKPVTETLRTVKKTETTKRTSGTRSGHFANNNKQTNKNFAPASRSTNKTSNNTKQRELHQEKEHKKDGKDEKMVRKGGDIPRKTNTTELTKISGIDCKMTKMFEGKEESNKKISLQDSDEPSAMKTLGLGVVSELQQESATSPPLDTNTKNTMNPSLLQDQEHEVTIEPVQNPHLDLNVDIDSLSHTILDVPVVIVADAVPMRGNIDDQSTTSSLTGWSGAASPQKIKTALIKNHNNQKRLGQDAYSTTTTTLKNNQTTSIKNRNNATARQDKQSSDKTNNNELNTPNEKPQNKKEGSPSFSSLLSANEQEHHHHQFPFLEVTIPLSNPNEVPTNENLSPEAAVLSVAAKTKTTKMPIRRPIAPKATSGTTKPKTPTITAARAATRTTATTTTTKNDVSTLLITAKKDQELASGKPQTRHGLRIRSQQIQQQQLQGTPAERRSSLSMRRQRVPTPPPLRTNKLRISTRELVDETPQQKQQPQQLAARRGTRESPQRAQGLVQRQQQQQQQHQKQTQRGAGVGGTRPRAPTRKPIQTRQQNGTPQQPSPSPPPTQRTSRMCRDKQRPPQKPSTHNKKSVIPFSINAERNCQQQQQQQRQPVDLSLTSRSTSTSSSSSSSPSTSSQRQRQQGHSFNCALRSLSSSSSSSSKSSSSSSLSQHNHTRERLERLAALRSIENTTGNNNNIVKSILSPRSQTWSELEGHWKKSKLVLNTEREAASMIASKISSQVH